MIFHTFSLGFISGFSGGHFTTAIPSSSRKLNTVLAFWQGALSCINIGVSTDSLLKWRRVCFFINPGTNITAKTNNGSNSRGRNPPTHHYAPPPNLTVFLTHWGDKRSPFLRHTNLLPSDRNKLNLDSSQKWTIFHCSSVYTICFVTKPRQSFWFSLKSKVCDIETEPLIFPNSKYEKQFFWWLAFLFAHKMHKKWTLLYQNGLLKTF